MIILYIPLTSKKCTFPSQSSIFPENNNPFSIKPTEKHQFFQFKISLQQASKQKETHFVIRKNFEVHDIGTELFTIFQSEQNNGIKLWAFDGYSGAFPYKVTPDIDFTDKVVAQCDVPDVKVVLVVIYK